MRCLITGATGLIGSHLLRQDTEHTLAGTYNTNRLVPDVFCEYIKCDIRNDNDVYLAFEQFKPDIVIHTAAKASPDWCSKNPEESNDVNVMGSKYIIRQCRETNTKLVFISSNAIYNGKGAPYNEESEINPNDLYGEQKATIETEIKKSKIDYLIIRSMCVYGWNNPYERKNFTTLLIERMMRGESMEVTNDLFCNFIYVKDLAKIIWLAIEGEWNQTYNASGNECLTHWDYTQKVNRIFEFKNHIKPIQSSNLQGYIKRPTNTCFINDKVKSLLDPRSIERGIIDMKEDFNREWMVI